MEIQLTICPRSMHPCDIVDFGAHAEIPAIQHKKPKRIVLFNFFNSSFLKWKARSLTFATENTFWKVIFVKNKNIAPLMFITPSCVNSCPKNIIPTTSATIFKEIGLN